MATTVQKNADKIAAEQRRAFYDRRHPAYNELLSHWLFLEAAYRGGRSWFTNNLFRYYKEGEKEFEERMKRAYRFNHTREVVELVHKYLFKAAVTRNKTDTTDTIKKFWANTTLNGLNIDQFMRTVSIANSVGGRCAVVVDNNFVAPTTVVDGKAVSKPVSVADAKAQNYRIYAYVVSAKDILDYAYDEDGDGGLLWIKLREVVRDDADPLLSSGLMADRVRLWTRTHCEVYEEVADAPFLRSGKEKVRNVVLKEKIPHSLGRVPVILADHVIGSEPYHASGLIDDIAYLDRAVTNYLSNLDAIIQDQTFSQLAIPAQSIQPGDDLYNKIIEMSTKRAFVYDGGAGSSAAPEFISPDPKQAGVILSVINKIINEIYHTIGLAGERTKQDNAVGIDNSSGVAKAYDFERVNSLLLSKAQSCERVESQIIELVAAWAGEKLPDTGDVGLITYPTTFDVMRLADDLVTAEALAKLGAPPEARREQMRLLLDKMFPQLKKDIREAIYADIKKWLSEPQLSALTPPSQFGTKPVASPSSQGSVTSTTPAKKDAAGTSKAP